MLGLMGFSGSLPLYVIHRYYIFVFIDQANKDACLLAYKRFQRRLHHLFSRNFSTMFSVQISCSHSNLQITEIYYAISSEVSEVCVQSVCLKLWRGKQMLGIVFSVARGWQSSHKILLDLIPVTCIHRSVYSSVF